MLPVCWMLNLLIFLASITQDNIIALLDTVGEIASYLFMYFLHGCQSMHPGALIVPSLYLIRTLGIAWSFCSYDISSVLLCKSASCICYCFSSLSMALSPSVPKCALFFHNVKMCEHDVHTCLWIRHHLLIVGLH